MTDNLENIIKGCIAGKNASREMLYKQFSAKLWPVCLRYAGSYDEAKDILQEGFIRIFDKIAQYEGRGNFEGWIRRIVVNIALAEFRKKKNLMVDLNHPIAQQEETNDHVEFDLSADELLLMINKLSPQYKIVFNLYAIEGYSHKEIAEMLNISEGTSKSNLSRAREILQKKVYLENANRQIIG